MRRLRQARCSARSGAQRQSTIMSLRRSERSSRRPNAEWGSRAQHAGWAQSPRDRVASPQERRDVDVVVVDLERRALASPDPRAAVARTALGVARLLAGRRGRAAAVVEAGAR